MRASRRLVVVRALLVLVISCGAVVGLATAAGAKPINSVKGLKTSCAKGSGTYSQATDGSSAICDLPGGKTVICQNKKKGKKKCAVVDTIARELDVDDNVITPDGVKLTTPAVPDSQVWHNRANVSVLGDVCASLRGDFIAPAGSALAACATRTATIVCQDTSTSCVGLASQKVVRDLLKLLIDSYASCNVSTTPSTPRPRVTGSTSTTSAPTTTVPPTTTTTDPMLQ